MTPFQEAVDRAIHLARVDPPDIEQALGVQLTKTEERGSWEFFDSQRRSGLFGEVSYRWDHATDHGLLVVRPSGTGPPRNEIELERYGEIVTMSVNAEIRPSGAETLVYDVAGVKVGWCFHSGDTTVEGVSVEFPPVDC